MKKKIFGGIAVLAIAAVAAWNVNLSSQSSDMSDVSLANVEALAAEIPDGTNCSSTAPYSY
ncbi:hypothetical protein AGMMS50239_41270 [Bacteroidia bacterium]|nr:hypothetical protein AGMMS50239_41270 [Bacteroidia bacterium]